jgi:hypothetical protein
VPTFVRCFGPNHPCQLECPVELCVSRSKRFNPTRVPRGIVSKSPLRFNPSPGLSEFCVSRSAPQFSVGLCVNRPCASIPLLASPNELRVSRFAPLFIVGFCVSRPCASILDHHSSKRFFSSRNASRFSASTSKQPGLAWTAPQAKQSLVLVSSKTQQQSWAVKQPGLAWTAPQAKQSLVLVSSKTQH